MGVGKAAYLFENVSDSLVCLIGDYSKESSAAWLSSRKLGLIVVRPLFESPLIGIVEGGKGEGVRPLGECPVEGSGRIRRRKGVPAINKVTYLSG